MRSHTYLITGSAGFIGSNICKQILQNNKHSCVVGIDNYDPYYWALIKKHRIKELSTYKNFIFIRSSFAQKQVLLSIQKKYKPTVLIHTAAKVGVRNGERNPVAYFQTNALNTATLLETIGKTIRHSVLFSSSSVYGITKTPFKETSILRPLSAYGISKMCMEEYATYFFQKNKTPLTIVRPFSVYGPNGRPDMLPMKLLFMATTNIPMQITGEHVARDWSYIDDVTSAVIRISGRPNGLRIINVGRGMPLSNQAVIRIAQKIIRSHGYTLRYAFKPANPIEMPITCADTKLLQTAYNVAMPTSFESGYQKTAEFFFSNRTFYSQYV